MSESTLKARDRILLTAHELFYRHGIRATGVDRLISESGVAKLTFYRHFPSKDDLVLAFLEYRHDLWMGWFEDALARHGATPGGGLAPVCGALREWFAKPEFRGCAFINAVAEVGDAVPGVREIACRHKDDMTRVIRSLLPRRRASDAIAEFVAVAVDGSIVCAQIFGADRALASLETLLNRLEPDTVAVQQPRARARAPATR
jgi:AcrR family transcriptional regulator